MFHAEVIQYRQLEAAFLSIWKLRILSKQHQTYAPHNSRVDGFLCVIR